MDLRPLFHQLNESRNEIRLLRLLPASTPSRIECELEVVSLDRNYLIYRAVSYEWGLPDDVIPSTQIVVNGHQVTTTPNLRLALTCLQEDLEEDEIYWIDALCINQSDDTERAQQVRLMTRIYSAAYSVDIWLGADEGNAHLGLDMLGDFKKSYGSHKATKIHSRSMQALADIWIPKYKDHWDGLFQLLSRSYWKRLWIVQEIVVASHPERVYLHCGSRSQAFKWLNKIVDACEAQCTVHETDRGISPEFGTWQSLSRRIATTSLTPHQISRHAEGWRVGNRGDRVGLLRLLADYNMQLCTEPRDKVYALLGVSLPYKSVELEISYSLPVPQLYKNVATYVIRGSERLDILIYCRHYSYLGYDLPSWVPDWTTYGNQRRVIKTHKNSWDASKSMDICIGFSLDQSILFTHAFILGSIKDLLEINDGMRASFSRTGAEKRRATTTTEKWEFFRWLNFVISTLQPDCPTDIHIVPSDSTLQAMLGAAALTSNKKKQVDIMMPYKRFAKFCRELYECAKGGLDSSQWPMMDLVIYHTIEGAKRLFAIDITPSQHAPSGNSLPSSTPGRADPSAGIITTIGVCAPDAQIGDVVAIIPGCKHPMLLRPKGRAYLVIAECYVHGFMDGEAVGMFEEVDIKLI